MLSFLVQSFSILGDRGSILVRQEVFLISYGNVTRFFGETNSLSRRKPVKNELNKQKR